MAIGGLKTIVLVGVPVLGLGVLLHIIAMATPAWTVYGAGEVGPWKICGAGICVDDFEVNSDGDAVRAFTVMGVLAGAGACVLSLLLVIMAIMGKASVKIMPMLVMGASAASFVCILLGAIIWAAAIHADYPSGYDLGYSFALTLVGCILVAAGGLLVFVGARGN